MISVTRIGTGSAHRVTIGNHSLTVDLTDADPSAGPDPHDLYDAALGACKALTMLWYAQRHDIPLETISVTVDRDASEERTGRYRLDTALDIGGTLTDAQRAQLLRVAEHCPVHRLMTDVTTEISTRLVDPAG
ncbi:OsmC family protein [Sandarakinorhabdus oryzae]|uniref:OsmC family protein n=1 Tax=Sandarakinorhabdus oryzae TaxID=2675220 RepID=UPI0012E1F2F8|nr:OsmC family protein [Sandarakinorhabdus oryzae]